MATFTKFEEIDCWKKARLLTNRIYSLSRKFPFSRDFGLRNQIRKAAVSVMSNIAEGVDRDGAREFVQFLAIAKGSASEVRCQLYIAKDQGYLSEEEFKELKLLATEISQMIAGLMRYLKTSSHGGLKYKKL